MKLSTHELAGLPKLAWLAVVNQLLGSVRVAHGAKVENRPGFFVEGVWDGDFVSGAFADTECFFGSGCTQNAGDLTFVSSASTTDYTTIYAVRTI